MARFHYFKLYLLYVSVGTLIPVIQDAKTPRKQGKVLPSNQGNKLSGIQGALEP